MLGGKNRKPLGYTIVEVMIVLAVSGVMFLIAASFINGKQQKAAFTQGINETASRIQDMIEQVTDGQYSDIPLHCQSGNPPTFDNSITSQGTNSPCVFMGKFFYLTGSSSYGVFSLAGNRLNGSSAPAVTLNDAQPVPVHGNGIDLTTQSTIPQNLTATLHINGSASPAYGFGFVQGLGSLNASDTTSSAYASGAQAVSLVYASGLNQLYGPANESGAVAAMEANILSSASSAALCLTDGTRYAQILIGNSTTNASQLNVTVQVVSTPC